jgi:hypothetical protein
VVTAVSATSAGLSRGENATTSTFSVSIVVSVVGSLGVPGSGFKGLSTTSVLIGSSITSGTTSETRGVVTGVVGVGEAVVTTVGEAVEVGVGVGVGVTTLGAGVSTTVSTTSPFQSADDPGEVKPVAPDFMYAFVPGGVSKNASSPTVGAFPEK